MQLTGFPMDEQGNRYPPSALTRNTPIGPVPQHRINTRSAPIRNPAHTIDSLLGIAEQAPLRHADKPLGSGSENNRRFVPPAVRVAVLVGFMCEQPFSRLQLGNNFIVRSENMLPFEDGCSGEVNTIAAHRIVYLQIIDFANVKVFQTVCRSGMYTAGAGFCRHMATQHERNFYVIKRWQHC